MSDPSPRVDIIQRPTIEAEGVEGEASVAIRDVTMSYVTDSVFQPGQPSDTTSSGLSPATYVEKTLRNALVEAGLNLEGYESATVDFPDDDSLFATVELTLRVSVMSDDRDSRPAETADD